MDNADEYKVVYLSDSLNHSLLDSSGSGNFNFNHPNGDKLSGQYYEGYMNGNFIEYKVEEKTTYYDIYQNGKFLKGNFKTDDGETGTYNETEIFPTFNGDYRLFLSRNLKYPKLALKKRITGRVLLNFEVEKDGSLTEFKVLKSASPLLDEEAVRVLSLSPKWKPGYKRGKPVRVSYTVPITFQLQ